MFILSKNGPVLGNASAFYNMVFAIYLVMMMVVIMISFFFNYYYCVIVVYYLFFPHIWHFTPLVVFVLETSFQL